MINTIIWGIILGLGAAIPFGPINVEITRRNLTSGIAAGLSMGFGACTADLFYLLLLCVGVINNLANDYVLPLIGFSGSLLLLWFGYRNLRVRPQGFSTQPSRSQSLLKHSIDGLLLTLLNPYTILFWASISSQVTYFSRDAGNFTLLLLCFGLIIGTVSWVIALNFALHKMRHRFSETAMLWLNRIGGLILLFFGVIGLYKVVAM